ncbi:hypothetical protein [Cytobacillus firmus]|uniref:hypothetical protein n=1 Tax=Cytobacillus firmus TaxID=1399 RepID=UPI0022283F0C|nr:hypothetical protein [Cytobacillus firmus]
MKTKIEGRKRKRLSWSVHEDENGSGKKKRSSWSVHDDENSSDEKKTVAIECS